MSAKEPSKQLGLFPKAPPSAAEVEAKERLRAAAEGFAKTTATNRPLVKALEPMLAERVADPANVEKLVRLMVLYLARREAHRAQPLAQQLGLVGSPTASAHWWVRAGEEPHYDFSRPSAFLELVGAMAFPELVRTGLRLTMLEDPIGINGQINPWFLEVVASLGIDHDAIRATLPQSASIEAPKFLPLTFLGDLKRADATATPTEKPEPK